MKRRRSLTPVSWSVSPSPPRKVASSPCYRVAPCSLSDLLQSTESSELPTRQGTGPRFAWYDSTFSESDSRTTPEYQDHCLPHWDPESWSCSLQTEPRHECRTHTSELLESASNDPRPEEGEQGVNDDTAARSTKFDFEFLQGIKWRTPSVLASLAVMAVFVLGIVLIAAVSGTVSGSKMEQLEVLPDIADKGEAKPVESGHVTSAMVEKRAQTTGRRSIWRSKVKRQKPSKRRRGHVTPVPRVVAHGHTVPITSIWRSTKSVRRSTEQTWVTPKISSHSRKPRRTRAAAMTKRRDDARAERTTLHGLRYSKPKTQKGAKRRLAKAEPKPRKGAHGRTVPSTPSRRRSKVVSHTAKTTWAPANSSRRTRKPRRTRAPATTKPTVAMA